MTGTIPEFLTTCFPVINEIDLSYNQVGAEPAALVEFLINMHFQLVEVLVSIVPMQMLAACYSVMTDGMLFHMCIPTCQV